MSASQLGQFGPSALLAESDDGAERETEIRLAISAFECTVPDRQGVLAAGPVSSGRRYLKLLRAFGLRSRAELVQRIGELEFHARIIAPNLEDGQRFAAKLRRAGHRHVVFTGPLCHPQWMFDDYMQVCTFLLEKKCRSVQLPGRVGIQQGFGHGIQPSPLS